MKDIQKEKLILRTIQAAGLPVGASYLSRKLDLAPATIGRVLASLEDEELVVKVSNKGRVLTPKGEQYLLQETAIEEKQKTAEELADMTAENDKDTLLEILQVRRLLEGYTVEQACKYATDEQIEKLEVLMLEHCREVRGGGLGSGIDFAFHMEIAHASKVKTIYQILKLILTEDNAYSKFSSVSDRLKTTQIKQHEAIIQAIKERNPEKAKKAMDEHLLQIMRDVGDYYDGYGIKE